MDAWAHGEPPSARDESLRSSTTMRCEMVPFACQTATLLLAALSLIACGGGERSITGTQSSLAIVVAPMTAVVHAGGAIQLTAAVSMMPAIGALLGECPAQLPMRRISPATTASGMPATYTAPAVLPANGARISITASTIADASASAAAPLSRSARSRL